MYIYMLFLFVYKLADNVRMLPLHKIGTHRKSKSTRTCAYNYVPTAR